MSFYKGLLRFVQLGVVLVVLPRVASFLALLGGEPGFDIHDLIRVAFAATLGLGVMATSYFSELVLAPEYDDEPNNPRERKRREREAVYFAAMNNAAPIARRAMWVFAFLDGTFNLADAFYGASRSGIIDPTLQGSALSIVYGFATFIFGIAPTLLAIVLSRVISVVDRIPKGFEKTPSGIQVDMLYTIMRNMGLNVYSKSQATDLLRSEDVRSLPEPSVERTDRTNGEHRTGEQRARIMAYLNANGANRSYRDIREQFDDPKPSISTIADAVTEWKTNRGGQWQS